MDTGTCPYGMFNFTIPDDDISESEAPNPIVFQRLNEGWTVRLWLVTVS